VEFEYQRVFIPRDTSRGAALRLLTDHAEYGHWELERTRLFPDGSRSTDTESLVVSWFVTSGSLDRQKSAAAQDNPWDAPAAAPAGQNVLVVAVVRDQRGGEAHFVLAL